MAYYYRKPINITANDVKLKMQMTALTLKLSENINRINDLIEVDKSIKKDIDYNSNSIENMSKNITNLYLSSNSKYLIENVFIYNIEIENSYKLSKDNPKLSIFNYDLVNEFRKDNILEINCRQLYQYTNYNNIGFLLHIFKLCDGAGTMLYEYKSLLTNAGDNRKNDLKQNDIFYVKLDDDYGVIKIELILSIIDNVTNTIDCKLYNTYNSIFYY